MCGTLLRPREWRFAQDQTLMQFMRASFPFSRLQNLTQIKSVWAFAARLKTTTPPVTLMQPLQLTEPRPAGARQEFALWALGFRPFYLLASAFASLSIALWALQFAGWLGRPYLGGPLWHAHEMLFGFALAVVVGFLLTAGRNWSGRPTLSGKPLAALAGLWLAGRVLVLTPYDVVAAIVTCAFPLAAAAALAVPFVASGNRRNYFFVLLLVLMGVAEGMVHLDALGWLAVPGWAGIQLGLDGMLFILAVMAGRVIPMFSNNGVPGAGALRLPSLEKFALAAVLVLWLADAMQMPAHIVAAVAAVACLAHLSRWLFWKPWKTRSVPLVWVLHLAYAWIPVHLALRSMALAGWVAPSLATHALTAGAMGSMVIGMMTRTALGHTGRMLKARRTETVCYVLVGLAALVRVVLPMAVPAWTVVATLAAAALWSTGFALYFWSYWPILTRARVDGLPG